MRELVSSKLPEPGNSLSPVTARSIGQMLIGPPMPRSSHAAVTHTEQYQLEQRGQCERHGPFQLYRPGPPGYPPQRVNVTCPACKRQSQFLSVMADADVPRRYQTATLDSWPIEVGTTWEADQRDALAACCDFANGFTQLLEDSGYGLLLLGDPGTGKTHLSYAVERSIREQRYTVARITAAQYLEKLWALDFKEREGWITKLAKADLLIFEELGRSSDTKGAQDAFFRLFDARWLEQRPNLFTSNLTLDAVKAVLGLATYDRAVKGSTVVTMSWSSFRGRS